jgi:hypothetical protein
MFEMRYYKSVTTSLVGYFKLPKENSPKNDEERSMMENIPYLLVVGSLMYVMVCIRPDIAHVMRVVSRFMSNSG